MALLESLASQWPGWDNFPWCVTRSLRQFIAQPPANFDYLLTHYCLVGYASHLVLTAKFENHQRVLALILREKFEITGMLRALLMDAIHAELHRTTPVHIQDCSGPDDGRTYAPVDELERRRQSLRACVDDAARDFVMVLNLACQRDTLDDRILGHSLQLWARGGDMPASVSVPVQVEVTPSGKVVLPCKEEWLAFLKAGITVPKLVIGKVPGGSCTTVRVQAKRVAAGRQRSVVRNKRDRTAIRVEVARLLELGMKQTEAFRQVADEAQHGRAGQRSLTTKYNLQPDEATESVIRRVFESEW